MPIGRPPDVPYTEALGDDICMSLMGGASLRATCEEPWAPSFKSVLRWLAKDDHPFRAKYARAREVQADIGADDIQHIADTHEIGEKRVERLTPDGLTTEVVEADMLEHRKLRISVRQWNAEKLRPKVYGAKQQIEHSGQIGVVLSNAPDEELIAEMLELLASGRVKLPKGIELHEDEEPEDDYSDIA